MVRATLILLLAVVGCTPKASTITNYSEEVKQTEMAFAQMAQRKGVSEAFLFYAAEDAVLLRNNQLIKGKAAIKAYFDEHAATYQGIELQWMPDKIEVAASGDLAYTYGSYQLINHASGQTTEGIFHTVWKRQSDGQWRFVWD
ncbi:YybH family protein [Carboxylicivirga taeanensis]|uniref:YybH family protein n=1 Tax=Carboxylicivirga taeanensis TaxID=1416875 RepID=UPI003F6E1A0A